MAGDVKKLIKSDPSAVDSWMPRLLDVIRADNSQFGDAVEDIIGVIRKRVIRAIKSEKGKYSQQFVTLCELASGKRTLQYYILLATILEERSLINWKDQLDAAEKLIESFEKPGDLLRTEDDTWLGPDRKPADCELGKAIQKCMKYMLTAFSKEKIIKEVNAKLVALITKCFEEGKEMQIVVIYGIVHSEMNWENTEKQYPALFKAIGDWIQRDCVDLSTVHPTEARAVSQTFSNCFLNSSDPFNYSKDVFSIWDYCLQHDLEGEPLCSGYGQVIMNIITGYLMKHYNTKDAVRDFVPGVMQAMKCDVPVLAQCASTFITCIYTQTELLSPCADDVLDVYLEGDSSTRSMLGVTLRPLYKSNSEKVMRRFSALIEEYEDMPPDQKLMVYMMWEEVAKDNPQSLIPHIDTMMKDISNQHCSNLVLSIFVVLSQIAPDKFEDSIEDLVKIASTAPYPVYQIGTIIANVGSMINQEQGQRCLNALSDLLSKTDAVWQASLVQQMKRIGLKYKDDLNKYRIQIEDLRDSPGMSDVVQSVMDFLGDRSQETLDGRIQETKGDGADLGSQVSKTVTEPVTEPVTETEVTRVDSTVTEQGQDLQNVQNEVNEQGGRLDELEQVVDQTVEKVDENDNKTIHETPKWSGDVSKLLNPKHEYDWRYLAVRLGFTSEEIRNWEWLFLDPAMAVLAEWYTIHKSSDATYAILTALEDMGRTDCTEIIEEALKEADQLVPREHVLADGETTPKVFLSYEWDHQPEVIAIKQHLEMAGYPCWMDIGQMGDGDQLLARISEGMRASKVVLCMCTEKYSKSESCNKEVNLANLLNKPIIPILIDKMPWPPKGSMSMLFSQLLYIQFYNDKEYVRGEQFWEDAMCFELLYQINYHCAPDLDMVTEEYRNRILGSDVFSEDKSILLQNQQCNEAPDIFLSYQWDTQHQIRNLYARLTKIGFRCWLDIYNIEAGDPLYTKIDKGLRKAKVVISSVTSKYALSANCRREISLADVLQKPIIPLFMEDDMDWPPEGPMEIPFTHLQYIDCSNGTGMDDISDDKFEKLVQKLSKYVSVTEVCADKNNGTNNGKLKGEVIETHLSDIKQSISSPKETVKGSDSPDRSQKKSPKKSPKKSSKKRKSLKRSPKKEGIIDSRKRSQSCTLF